MNSPNRPLALALAISIFAVTGCTLENGAPEIALEKRPGAAARSENNENVSRRFDETSQNKANVVQSAVELTEKYAAQSEKLSGLKQQNSRLTEENQQLKARVSLLEPQLRQTQKELDSANSLLVEMRVELNNWKNDVLGFRDEIRMAQKAQLEALQKILQLLGGEYQQPQKNNDNNN